MAGNKSSWGIEIGSNAIKAIHLSKAKAKGKGGDGVVVLDYEVLPFKRVLTTPDLNADEAVRVGLDQLMNKHKINKANVVISLPGSAAFARFAKLPPVDPKRILDIVKFEAVQQIPFPIEQVEWDYQVFAAEDSPDVEVGIFAVTKERLSNFMRTYLATGLKIDAMTMSPLAVFNAMVYDEQIDDDTPGVIYMDIGTVSTDVIIVEHGQIWLRTLQIGGNHFTEALVRAFKLSFHKAEKLKREAGTSKYARQIFQAMRPVFSDLVQEIQRSLGYYQSLNRDSEIEKLVGFGSTFRLPGMMKFLKQQLQIDVSRPDSLKRLSVEGADAVDFADHSINLATAYGLALQGLELEKVNANLLPRRELRQRVWSAKQPWIAAAAAIILVASLAGFIRLQNDKSVYHTALSASERKVDNIVRTAQSLKSQFQQISGADPRVRINNLRRILDYRDVWPKLIQDVSLAAAALGPQPELLTPDYAKHREIRRHERRRIFIDSIDVQYSIGQPEASSASSSPSDEFRFGEEPSRSSSVPQSMSMQQLFGESKFQPGKATEASGGLPTGVISSTPVKTTPPQFEITLRGTTPLRDATRELSRTFIQWLQDNAIRQNRPYVIEAGSDTLVEITFVGKTGGRASGANLNTGGSRNAASRRLARSRAGRNRREESFGFEDSGVGGGRDKQSLGLDDVLPSRPGLDDPRDKDQRFIMRWRVELLSPEDVRLTEEVRRAAASGTDGDEESNSQLTPIDPVDSTGIPSVPDGPLSPQTRLGPGMIFPSTPHGRLLPHDISSSKREAGS